MVRRSQTSNPRSAVVLAAGTDWGTRVAGQSRSSGAESPMPRRQAAKAKALQQTIGVVRAAIKAKRWHQARYMLSRARALVNALPADQTTQEREQLSVLRKRFEARDTVAAKNARSAKKPPPKPAARASSKKSSSKSTANMPRSRLNCATDSVILNPVSVSVMPSTRRVFTWSAI
ncbi:hypothetical protein [Streptomyces sp. NPDC059949]|uniref:hypothetical protein n=1 Tax=Streptomyces sp. NPDC059949 TaxID=3347013 RepID=UPI003656000B